MKPKERVLAALNHQTTDRVPIALCSGYWDANLEQGLKEYFYLRGTDTLHAFFGIDAYWVEPVYRGPAFDLDDSGHRLGIYGTPEYSQTYSQALARPLAAVTSVAEIEAYPWPQIDHFDFSTVTHFANLYRDYAIVSPRRWSPTFDQIADLTGFETAMMYLVTQPKIVEAMVEAITHWNCIMWEHVLDAAPGLIDICYVGDDPAGQLDMLISPKLWRRFFKPAFRRLFSVAKARGVKVMFHMCGNATAIIPDLIEIGVDVLMPVQVSAQGMEPLRLKQAYGKDISFWGAIDTQHVLPESTPQQVRAEVRRMIDVLGKDGGYILSSSHNLTSDIPIENIWAMYDEAARYYPYS
jgi:uroporphyrinogen decarboxylase